MYLSTALERWRDQSLDKATVLAAASIDPFVEREVAGVFVRSHGARVPKISARCTRLVLDCHPALEEASLQRVISRVMKRWSEALEQLGLLIAVGTAWRGAARPLAATLRAVRNVCAVRY